MKEQSQDSLREKHIIACVWDFDKTLIPSYMQRPIFEEYGVDENSFWNEVICCPPSTQKRESASRPKRYI